MIWGATKEEVAFLVETPAIKHLRFLLLYETHEFVKIFVKLYPFNFLKITNIFSF